MFDAIVATMDGTQKAVVMAWLAGTAPILSISLSVMAMKAADWLDDKITEMR